MEWTYLAFGSREQLKLSQFPLISKKETSVNVVGALRERERERERERDRVDDAFSRTGAGQFVD